MMVFILFCLPIWPLQKTWWTLKDVRLPQTQPSSSSNFGFGARCDIIGRVDQHNIRYIVCSFVVTNLENSFFSVYSEKSIRKYIFIEQIIECFYISPTPISILLSSGTLKLSYALQTTQLTQHLSMAIISFFNLFSTSQHLNLYNLLALWPSL